MAPHELTTEGTQTMPSKPILLILDYPGRRPEAHISDLGLEDLGFDCRNLLTHPLPDEVSASEYARRLTDRAELPEHGVLAVLSYCSSAPLAAAIAARTVGQRPLPIVLFDAFELHRHHIEGRYAVALRQIEGGEPAPDGPPLLDVAGRIGQPALLVEELAVDLKARAKTALTSDGFDAAEAAESLGPVIGMYVEWMTYLLAVHHRTAAMPMGEVLHVVSQDHPADLGWLGTGDVRTVRIGCGRPDLARSEETRDAVREFLEKLDQRNRPEQGWRMEDNDFNTPTERRLAEIWADVLRLEGVKRDQDFFDIGGDSLLATKVVLRVGREWGIKCTVRVLNDAPVLAELAERIDQLVEKAAGPPAPSPSPEPA